MNEKFDELAKGLAQSVTRRQALKKFGVGLVGMALACFGLANSSQAGPKTTPCACLSDADCSGSDYCFEGICIPNWCDPSIDQCCCYCPKETKGKTRPATGLPPCAPYYQTCVSVCGAQVLGC